MRKLPPLNAIRAFEAAARHRSFTIAAGELCVTVTAVSHQVRHLEAVLGLKLFERSARAVSLTPSGERLYPLLRDGFDRLGDAFAALREEHLAEAITVSTTRAFAERWLMPRLPNFTAAFPNIMVHIDATEDAVDLRAGGIDLAIRYGSAADPAAHANVLLEDVYVAVADQAICPQGRSAEIDDFRSRPLLAYRWKNRTLDAPTWSAWLARTSHSLAGDFRISWFSEETLALHAVGRAFGPLLCSNILVDDELRCGKLQRIDGPILTGFAYRLVDLPLATRKKSLTTFIAWLQDETAAFRQRSSSAVTGRRAA
jgi:LysR family transcriptional regulator, glycine cleavage system transcriptional activator